MAATINPPAGGSGTQLMRIRNRRTDAAIFTIDLDNSYPQAAGGYDISTLFNQFKLEANATNLFIFLQSRLGYVFDVDYVNKRLKVYRQSAATSALTEVANAVDLSTVVGIRALVFGTPGG